MAAKTPAAARRAQRGALLADVFPTPQPATAKAPSRAPRASRGARAPAPGAAPGGLTGPEREQVAATFLALVEGLYAHLPLKRARYASDPVQRLRLLVSQAPGLDDAALHTELAAVLTGLRDAHTRYVGPAALAGRAAMLPFLVESYGAPPDYHYVVSKVATDRSLVPDDRFVAGVELRWWNGVPIDLAVDRHAERETGGRPDSRRARALESLTYRALQFGPPPDERWVVVGYVDDKGTEREVRIDWRVVEPAQAATAAGDGPGGWAHAVDPAAEATRRVKKLLFAPERWLADQKPAAARRRKRTPPPVGEWIDTAFGDNVAAKDVATPSGRFGYLRLWSFDLDDDRAYVEEVVELLGLLSPDGLIVDLRANPGGLIWAAERLLQLFTPEAIRPTRFSVLATPLTRAMALRPQNEAMLAPWRDSLVQAVATGELYSNAVPITPEAEANDIGQVYGGPVVAVVDANTYSAGDLFAAGFVDNGIGPLVTVGQATGAGGANVWEQSHVTRALLGSAFALPVLPAGIGFTISVRRATRAGPSDGTAIEDVGVSGRPYAMSKADLVGTAANADLLAHCGAILANRPRTALALRVARDGGVTAKTAGLDRLDLYADGKPVGSQVVTKPETDLALPEGWQTAEVAGFEGGALRQRRRLRR